MSTALLELTLTYGMGESKKKDAVWRQKEARIILFKFNAVAERRQWSSAASIPRRKSQLTQVINTQASTSLLSAEKAA